jgi:adenosylcobyric acid synthase
MVQGTTSDAGKTVLVAGICRVLARRGLRVVPFKPQNMALNSAVTSDDGEIGRAQALQAIACGLEPHSDMNPVLLKPSSDTGAQVIIHGKALTTMQAQDFHDYKKFAMDAVLSSYKRLQAQYDFIIVEGAGSPAEINLRKGDIANMGFAEAVDCPVIIIADIDRGGVFAHLVGTLDLLSASEQNRVTGFVINRFRGDIALLESGLDWLEERTDKKVWGVIPYLTNFYLDAEDAIQLQTPSAPSLFKIVVPVFSRISNHTDFDALQLHPEINLEFIAPGSPLPAADLIILPGTKNVRGDLELLYQYGWDESIKRHLRYGGKLMGICGGYQMLGELIEDPDGIEDKAGASVGLGLLNISTRLTQTKILQNRQGYLRLQQANGSINNASFKAYEIHCGNSSGTDQYHPFAQLIPQAYGEALSVNEGIINHDNNIIGTYLHGLFDEAHASNSILAWAGLKNQNAINLSELREQQLNRLADCLEESLDAKFFEQFGVR